MIEHPKSCQCVKCYPPQNFCLNCGRLVQKDFCNEKCLKAYERKQRSKSKSKYSAAY